MARDGRESDRGESGFVDRDDDRDDGLVDTDYDDSFPGEPGEAMEDAPDPGYTAYAEEFEDPLADWPSPDRPFDELPERRRAQDRRSQDRREDEGSAGSDDPDTHAGADTADDTDVWEEHEARVETQEDDEDRPQTLDPTDAFAREASRGSTRAAFDEATLAPPGPDRSDSDDDAFVDDWLAADADEPPPAAGPGDGPPVPAMPAPPQPPKDEDDLIDDFLNDLDDVDEADTYSGGMSNALDSADAADGDVYAQSKRDAPDSAAERLGAAALGGAASSGRRDDIERDTHMRARSDTAGGDGDGGSRLIPWVMVAVVALALVLLAVGGYGVVKQRSELEEQIRDLQAQLATAVTTEEVAAERERQREIERENEALAAELEGLQAENSALAQDIAALEARLAEQETEAEQEALRAAEAAAAAEQRAASQRAASAASTGVAGRTVAAAGPWFVNFGSYAQRDIAGRWASRLEVDDGEVVVQSAQAGGRTLFRVRVVGLASQDDAESVATTLERQYQLPRLWVGRN